MQTQSKATMAEYIKLQIGYTMAKQTQQMNIFMKVSDGMEEHLEKAKEVI